jgi:hypothetical protein
VSEIEFCYWLQGFTDSKEKLFPDELAVLREKLEAVLAPKTTLFIPLDAEIDGDVTTAGEQLTWVYSGTKPILG